MRSTKRERAPALHGMPRLGQKKRKQFLKKREGGFGRGRLGT